LGDAATIVFDLAATIAQDGVLANWLEALDAEKQNGDN
jgi:hypothetical protein